MKRAQYGARSLLIGIPVIAATILAIGALRAPDSDSRLQVPIAILFLIMGVVRLVTLRAWTRGQSTTLVPRFIHAVSLLGLGVMLLRYKLMIEQEASLAMLGLLLLGSIAQVIANRAEDRRAV